jgi:Rod binding domain-containing protein
MSSPALLTGLSFGGAAGAGSGKGDDPAKIRDASEQFESLLLAQLLSSARESDGGWLGGGSDSASDCAFSLADQQLAIAMAKSGGFGLAKLVASGLSKTRPGD